MIIQKENGLLPPPSRPDLTPEDLEAEREAEQKKMEEAEPLTEEEMAEKVEKAEAAATIAQDELAELREEYEQVKVDVKDLTEKLKQAEAQIEVCQFINAIIWSTKSEQDWKQKELNMEATLSAATAHEVRTLFYPRHQVTHKNNRNIMLKMPQQMLNKHASS